ncbi:putative membrane-associated kinase regulator [Arachis hypogaea]|nr:putative membrane-associated kinase regulator [Arachis hypogaea]
MDSLNFLKFWRNNPSPMTTTTAQPHLVVETDIESDDDEEDSFFDLELTLHDMQTPKQTKHDTDDVPSISKRKVLPIEPISKPQSPIALLKSAPASESSPSGNAPTQCKKQRTIHHTLAEGSTVLVRFSRSSSMYKTSIAVLLLQHSAESTAQEASEPNLEPSNPNTQIFKGIVAEILEAHKAFLCQSFQELW